MGYKYNDRIGEFEKRNDYNYSDYNYNYNYSYNCNCSRGSGDSGIGFWGWLAIINAIIFVAVLIFGLTVGA